MDGDIPLPLLPCVFKAFFCFWSHLEFKSNSNRSIFNEFQSSPRFPKSLLFSLTFTSSFSFSSQIYRTMFCAITLAFAYLSLSYPSVMHSSSYYFEALFISVASKQRLSMLSSFCREFFATTPGVCSVQRYLSDSWPFGHRKVHFRGFFYPS